MSTRRRVSTLGPYTAGEIPPRWEHQFCEVDGVTPIDLTDWDVGMAYRVDGGDEVTRAATLGDADNGWAGYTWVEDDCATAGLLTGELWVQAPEGSPRMARRVEMWLRPSSGGGPYTGED